MRPLNLQQNYRLASLDYLRGLSAFGIMVFHYLMWSVRQPDSADFLGRVGIYGVVIFYMLSGITLFHVYSEQIGSPSKTGLFSYFTARFFRIYPLLWLLTIATLVVKKEEYSLQTEFLNFTGLFSIYHWGDTICYGAWSIGNELVFYLFFPLFIFLSNRSKLLFAALSAGLVCIFFWYTFWFMDSSKPLSAEYWMPYINPLNQVQYFLGGYLIGYFTKNLALSAAFTLPLIIISILAFIYYPAAGDAMALVSGFNRIAFTIICLLLCLGVYKSGIRLPGPLHFVFGSLGEISYSLYLLHPLTAYIFPRLFKGCFTYAPMVGLLSGFIFTILLSYILYNVFERSFMKIGKFVSRKMTSDSQK